MAINLPRQLLLGELVSIQSTAHHEASHAVAAWHFEIPFEKVSIVQEGDTLGCVRLIDPLKGFHPDRDYPPRETRVLNRLADRWAISQLAGPIGAWLFDPGAHTDYKEHETAVVNVFASLYGDMDEVATRLGDLLERTERLLRRKKMRVALAADLLLEKSEISASEFGRLMEGANRRKSRSSSGSTLSP